MNAAPGSDVAGTRIGRYRVESLVGSGGMGAVYRAVDPLLGRTVAVKVLSTATEDPNAQERFFREARAIARLEHRNIVRVYEADAPEGTPYIAMEFLEGQDGRQFVKSNPSLTRSLDVMAQVFDGLACAHGFGVIHRDVKPGNMIVMPGDVVKLIDFGLARLSDDQRDLTRGQVFGSAPFMAPEQITTPGQVDARTDIYSAGVVLYGLVTGMLPFRGATVAETLVQIVHAPVPAIASVRPECPGDVVAIVNRCLAKDPSGRPSSAIEVAEALRRISHRISGPRAPILPPPPPLPPPPSSAITYPVPIPAAGGAAEPLPSEALTQYQFGGEPDSDAEPPASPPERPSGGPTRYVALTVVATGFFIALVAGGVFLLRRPGPPPATGSELVLPVLPPAPGASGSTASGPRLVVEEPPSRQSRLRVRSGESLVLRVRTEGASLLSEEPQWRLNDDLVASGSSYTFVAQRGPRVDTVSVSLPGAPPNAQTTVVWHVSVE